MQFHSLAANTLYATKLSRPDTCTDVAFLTTIVQSTALDDWAKMVHMMRYIRGTRTLPLIISDNRSGILKWCVYASFDVHPNTRGHYGGGLSLRRGFPIVNPTKNLNTCISTETELVGADDFMPEICWTWYFLKAKGYIVLDNILFQDNRSSIIMENNGKASSIKRNKHIKTWYLFITNRVAQDDVSLVWCPTGDMIGEFMTKPPQGALFRKFRDQIMGVIPEQDPGPGKAQPGKAQTGKGKPRKGK